MKTSQIFRISLLFALFILSTITFTHAQDVIIYDDQLNAPWENWSWDVTLDFSHSTTVNNGAYALSVTFDKAWAALSLHTSQPHLIQDYSELRFWIHSGTQSGQVIDILLIDENGNEAPQRYKIISLPGGGWHEYHVPLTSFGSANAITGFYWHDNSGQPQPTFYLDDITLVSYSGLEPTPTPIPTSIPHDPSIQTKWDLWNGPTHLRGANVIQRHVHSNVDGPTFFGPGPIGPPFTQTDFDRLAAMGANYVNISYSGIYTEKPPYQVDLDVQKGLDDLLAMIEKANMFAVICFRSGPGRSEFALYYGDWLPNSYRNDSVWNYAAAQDAWVDMWRYTTERYANNPIVVGFDLMVEPNSNEVGFDSFNPIDIWDPLTFFNKYGGSLLDFGPLSARIANEIRKGNTQIPILIAGNGYSAANWLSYVQLVNEPHIVYTCHQYAPHVYTGADWSQSNFNDYTYPGLFDLDYDNQKEQFNKTWLENELKPIDTFKQQHRVPVAINEYGVKRWVLNGHTFMDDQMEMFENLQVNYALWEWAPDWPNINSIDDYNFRHGPDPSKHTDLQSSDLIDTIKKYWSKNIHRPSTVQFKPSSIQWHIYE